MDIIVLLEKGGSIAYLLVLMNMIGFSFIIFKIFQLLQFKKNFTSLAKELAQNLNNQDQISIETSVQNSIQKLEFGLGTIRIIASTAPLLGLLGTVFGILLAFDTISKVGLDDPLAFSSGISIALVTTVVGLVVAIPHHIFYNYFIGNLDANEIKLKNEILKHL